MSGYFSTYGPPWLNPTQLVWPFCRKASRLCSWLKGRVVRDRAGCESCKGRLQAEREEVTHAEPAAQLATPEGTGVFARHSSWRRRCPWKYELEGAFKPPVGTLFSIFCRSLPSPSHLLSFLRLALTQVPSSQPVPRGDSPFQRLACHSCKGRDVGWKGCQAGFSLLREEERFPSLWRPGNYPVVAGS